MINTTKLKQARDAIDLYLSKKDPSTIKDVASKEAERGYQKQLLEVLDKKLDLIVSKNNQSFTDIGKTVNTEVMQKMLSTFIVDKLTPTLNDLKTSIATIKFPPITEKELGVDKLIKEVGVVEKAIKGISGHEVEMAEIGLALKGLQKSLDALVKKEIKIPEYPSIQNLPAVEKKLDELVKTVQAIPQNMPKAIPSDNIELVNLLKEVKQAISDIKMPEIEFPTSINVDNFPPQKIPQPVTNININPLRGFIKTTAQTVGTTLATLPGYGVLDNRRSVMVYNNDASAILFVGGSDVTTSNGMPVPPKSYSPILDAGIRMIFYGVSTTSINVRVMEASNEATGG